MTKEIKLTNSDLVAIVNDEHFEIVKDKKWYLVTNRNTNYACACMNNTSVYMHHFLFGKGMFDHKDHNGLNNQTSNVRQTNHSLNGANQRKRIGCLSTYKGVTFDKRRNHWTASLTKNGKRIHLGCFDTQEEAALAYNENAPRYFGEHALLNTIALAKVKGIAL